MRLIKKPMVTFKDQPRSRQDDGPADHGLKDEDAVEPEQRTGKDAGYDRNHHVTTVPMRDFMSMSRSWELTGDYINPAVHKL